MTREAAALVAAASVIEGGAVRLVIAAGAVARIVALTGLDRVIPVFATQEEALT